MENIASRNYHSAEAKTDPHKGGVLLVIGDSGNGIFRDTSDLIVYANQIITRLNLSNYFVYHGLKFTA